ncbi:MAG: AmmeMemoRadiSam system protein B [Anaerolineae bacterium]|nr:AmmeMemoRadiSam system protein B [Anaerolineae bacterium]
MKTSVRAPAVAGSFYPGNAIALRHIVTKHLGNAQPAPLTPVRAVIVPHAGYVYSGPIAGIAYQLLLSQAFQPARVVLMGPAHRVWFQGIALGDYTEFKTPLGTVPVDREFIQRLVDESNMFLSLPGAHTGEHCLEVQLPFLQVIYKEAVPIVPMLFGEVNPTTMGDIIARYITDNDLIVVSSDLSHFHDYDTASRLDMAFVDAVMRGDEAGVAKGEACGQGPILALMRVAALRSWQPHLLDYRNSGDTAGDKQRVVGYTAIAYTGS